MTQEEISRRLMTAMMSMRHLFRKDPIAGLKRAEFGLLMMIHHHNNGEGMKVSEISAHMQVTSPSVTQLVTAVEAKGLVSRAMDPSDRRSVRVTLTEQGQAAVELAEKDVSDAFAKVMQRMGEEKLLELTELLTEMGAIAAQIRGEKPDLDDGCTPPSDH